jgi:lipoate-protein ligase A
VEAVTVRLLPFAAADGPHNMAADEVLLQAAEGGLASLRFYGWTVPTVSLGYFQTERVRREEPQLASLPYVRRPSGGATLVHHHEVTYALGLPAGSRWQAGTRWLRRMHEIVADALQALGVSAPLQPAVDGGPACGVLCFRHVTVGDLMIGTTKVVGSAQRRRHGALLQHGAVLLARSPHAPVLPGIAELTGRELAVADVCGAAALAFARQTGWHVEARTLSGPELQQIERLAREKYADPGWNQKR